MGDHVLRAAMLERLEKMPWARSILPFVMLSCATPSKCSWYGDDRQKHTVTQVEGGEQGDPLMPLLFSIGNQGALEEVSCSSMENGCVQSSVMCTHYAHLTG